MRNRWYLCLFPSSWIPGIVWGCWGLSAAKCKASNQFHVRLCPTSTSTIHRNFHRIPPISLVPSFALLQPHTESMEGPSLQNIKPRVAPTTWKFDGPLDRQPTSQSRLHPLAFSALSPSLLHKTNFRGGNWSQRKKNFSKRYPIGWELYWGMSHGT